jgi:hypothetical protein
MGNSPFKIIKTPRFRVQFILGGDDDPDTVENIDAVVTARDRTRWSVTFLTLGEISRIMDRWADTGEALGGHFFQCPDLVIVREGGLDAMVKALEGIFDEGGPGGTLPRLN